jgi:hypothetical protein
MTANANEWIADRQPTAADGDMDGYVRIKPTRGVDYVLMHWSFVGVGAPWQHASHWNPPSEPTPAKPDRIAALGWFEAELSPSAALAALTQSKPLA